MSELNPDYICIPKKLHEQFSDSVLRSILVDAFNDTKHEKYQQGFKHSTPNAKPKTFWYRIENKDRPEREKLLHARIVELMENNGLPEFADDGKRNYSALFYKMAPETSIEVHQDWMRKTVFLLPLFNYLDSRLHICETEESPPYETIPMTEGVSFLFDASGVWHNGENTSKSERVCFCFSFFKHNYHELKRMLD